MKPHKLPMLKEYRKKFIALIFVISFLLIGIPNAVRGEILVINILTILAVLFVIWKYLKDGTDKFAYLALAILVCGYVASAYFVVREFCPCDLSEPKEESYFSDEADFLKTFYLMEH